jgi:hypothetical protein
MVVPEQYSVLELRIGGELEGLSVGAILEEAGGQRNEVQSERVPVGTVQLAARQTVNFISSQSIGFQPSFANSRSLDPVKELGAELFSVVQYTPAGKLYEKATLRAEHEGGAVSVRVIPENELAASLPWEILYDTGRRGFLALSLRSPLVRRGSAPPSTPISEPLRILVAAADTNKLTETDRDIKMLLELQQNYSDRIKPVQVLEEATPENLAEALASGPYHVIHFTGTGVRGTGTGVRGASQQALKLFDRVDGVSARWLEEAIAAPGDVRIIFLSADYTDQMARELAHHFPVTIGVRELIRSESATRFAQVLYSGLLAGDSVESSVTRARYSLDTDNPGVRDWALMTVYAHRHNHRAEAAGGGGVRSSDLGAGAAGQPRGAPDAARSGRVCSSTSSSRLRS